MPSPQPVWVVLDRLPISIDPGTTLHGLIVAHGLHASTGRLLAVDGSVLERRAYPGEIDLNGRPRPGGTPLAAGDRVRVVDGTDRVEAVRRRTRDVGRRLGDPERTLAVYPTKQITTLGRRSGLLVSRVERSLGPGRAPRAVALTFDDGPWPGATERVLRVLHRFHVHATFFMIGRQVARYPSIVRDVARRGNAIGNHSFSHPLTFKHLSARERAHELARTSAILAGDAVRTTLFRPPGGWYDTDLVQEAREQRMRLVNWSVDPRDWRSNVSPHEIERAVLHAVRPGSIVLLHDGGGDAAHTIAALPAIIRGIRHRGLGLVTIPAHPV